MKVALSTEARSDLVEIGDYIGADNPERAISFVQELLEKCHSFGDMPRAFPIVPRFEKYGIRRRTYGAYLIFFYTVTDHEIAIVRILHGAQDYARFLLSEE